MKTQPGKRVWSSFRQGVAVALAALAVYACLGATRVVPDFSSTIQAAIDSSAAGDTVLVRPGTYVENIHTDGKVLTLKSLGTPENTIIDGNQQGSVIWVTTDAHIEGFTIRTGLADNGGGIFVDGASTAAREISVTVVRNAISDNRTGFVVDSGWGGGWLMSLARYSEIRDNTFLRNYAGNSGGGVYSDRASRNYLVGNVFVDNGCHATGGGLGGGMQEVTGNLFLRNWSDTGGGGLSGVFVNVTSNTIVGNSFS